MSELISTGHDKFLSGRIFIYSALLHGTVQVLLQIEVLLTRVRTNFYTVLAFIMHFWISSAIDYSCCIKSIKLDKSIMLHKSKLRSK